MKFNLKNKVLPNGFNKRAVITALSIVLVIVLGFVGYVLSNNTLGSGSTSGSDAKQKTEINDDMANLSTIINIANTKPAASIPLASTLANKGTESGALTSTLNVPAIQQQKVETEYDKQARQIENQAKMKKLQAQYAALDSKSSMTGNGSKDSTASTSNNQTPPKSNASSTVGSVVTGGGAQGASSTTGNTSSPYLDSELIKPKSPYLLQAGSIVPCVMISGINSDISGQVIAQVRENVYDSISSRYLLIPQGSKLLGSFSNQVAYGQKRLGVAWTRVIYPNGYSIDLRGIPGSDVSGFSGFYDQVDNHYWAIFGSSFVIGMITAGMQYSQNNTNPNVQVGGLGISTTPTIGQTISGSLGQQLGQTGSMVAQKGLNVAPTITIRQGYMFTIMLTADVALKPYNQS